MTVIEIKPHRWGWKACEAPGVEPVFLEKDHAIDYAQNRACFRSGEIRVLDSSGKSNALLRSVRRIESCDCYADNLCKADGSLGWVSAVDSCRRTIWIADAHRDGKRYIVRADEKLTAFMELESAIRSATRGKTACYKNLSKRRTLIKGVR